MGQLAALRKGKVEQSGQHACGQLNRNPVHPIEGFTHWQVVQYVDSTLAYDRGNRSEVLRSGNGTDDFTLFIVFWSVHGNEHGEVEIIVRIANGDGGLGGKNLVRGVHLHDVRIARY